MLNRIYTRSEKEAIWKQKGLLRVPKSHRQEALVIASKEYIESLRCYWEVRRLLAAGKKPRDVAILIQRHSEYPMLTFNSIKKYAHVYRLFFIPPLEAVRSLNRELRCSQLVRTSSTTASIISAAGRKGFHRLAARGENGFAKYLS